MAIIRDVTPELRAALERRGQTIPKDKSHDAAALEALFEAIGFPKWFRWPDGSEYVFHPGRDWRFDYAWPDFMLAVELEGGIWTGRGRNAPRCQTCGNPLRHVGRHNSPAGIIEDMDKYNEAKILGWIVLNFANAQIRDGRALAALDRVFQKIRKGEL